MQAHVADMSVENINQAVELAKSTDLNNMNLVLTVFVKCES